MVASNDILAKAKRVLSPDEFKTFLAGLRAQRPEFIDESFPEQADFLRDRCRYKSLICGRRAGKSYAGAYELYQAAWDAPGSSCLYLTKTRETAKRIMIKDAMLPVAKRLGWEQVDSKPEVGQFIYNKSELSITLWNKSVIYFLGADSDDKEKDKMYGQKFALVIIDEAAIFETDVRELVYSVLKPGVMDLRGRIVLMGMPSVLRHGLFFDVTQSCSEPGNRKIADPKGGIEWSVHRWLASQNPYTASAWREDVEEMRRVNPDIESSPTFRREWLGLWGEEGESFFPQYPDATYKELPRELTRYSIGLDLAYSERKKSDWSIACVLGEMDGRWYVVEVLRRQVKAPDFADELRDLQEKYRRPPTRIYGFGMEGGVVDFLNRAGCSVSMSYTSKKKYQRAIPVSAAWGAKRILMPAGSHPWKQPFLDTLAAFSGVESPKVHDDDVDALAAAYDLLPAVRIRPKSPAPGSEEWMKQQANAQLEACRRMVLDGKNPSPIRRHRWERR